MLGIHVIFISINLVHFFDHYEEVTHLLIKATISYTEEHSLLPNRTYE